MLLFLLPVVFFCNKRKEKEKKMNSHACFSSGLFFNHGSDFWFVQQDTTAEFFRGVAVSDCAKIKNLATKSVTGRI